MYSLVKLLTLKGDCIDDFVVMDIGGDITDVGVVFSRSTYRIISHNYLGCQPPTRTA